MSPTPISESQPTTPPAFWPDSCGRASRRILTIGSRRRTTCRLQLQWVEDGGSAAGLPAPRRRAAQASRARDVDRIVAAASLSTAAAAWVLKPAPACRRRRSPGSHIHSRPGQAFTRHGTTQLRCRHGRSSCTLPISRSTSVRWISLTRNPCGVPMRIRSTSVLARRSVGCGFRGGGEGAQADFAEEDCRRPAARRSSCARPSSRMGSRGTTARSCSGRPSEGKLLYPGGRRGWRHGAHVALARSKRHGSPQLLDDGKHVHGTPACPPVRVDWDDGDIVVHAIDEPAGKVVVHGARMVGFCRRGHLIYVHEGHPVSPSPSIAPGSKPSAGPVPVLEGRPDDDSGLRHSRPRPVHAVGDGHARVCARREAASARARWSGSIGMALSSRLRHRLGLPLSPAFS